MHSSEIEKLINEVSKLPGLGRKSAQRIALYLLKNKERALLPLVQSFQEANQKIICFDIATSFFVTLSRVFACCRNTVCGAIKIFCILNLNYFFSRLISYIQGIFIQIVNFTSNRHSFS